MLQGVQPLIGHTEQGGLLIPVGRMHRNAEIKRDTDIHFERPELILIFGAYATTEGKGLVRVRLGQEQREFVPANAEGEIGGTQSSAERGSRDLQDVIALQMPETVIDLLQFVQVKNHDGELLAVTLGAI